MSKLESSTPQKPASKRKSLSGSTLQMRFMKRKIESTQETKFEEGSTSSNANKEQNEQNDKWQQHKRPCAYGTSPATEKNDDDCDSLIPMQASLSDIYGIDIIGRRSFNGKNKIVEETWKNAILASRQKRKDARIEKEHISDEELLRRYQKYIRGQGDEVKTGKQKHGERHSSNIGNLSAKVKKRKNPDTK